MWYLDFYLDSKLTFREYIRYYAMKAASTVNTLQMLDNLFYRLNSVDKR